MDASVRRRGRERPATSGSRDGGRDAWLTAALGSPGRQSADRLGAMEASSGSEGVHRSTWRWVREGFPRAIGWGRPPLARAQPAASWLPESGVWRRTPAVDVAAPHSVCRVHDGRPASLGLGACARRCDSTPGAERTIHRRQQAKEGRPENAVDATDLLTCPTSLGTASEAASVNGLPKAGEEAGHAQSLHDLEGQRLGAPSANDGQGGKGHAGRALFIGVGMARGTYTLSSLTGIIAGGLQRVKQATCPLIVR